MEAAGEDVPRDPFGHVQLDKVNPGPWFAKQFAAAARRREGAGPEERLLLALGRRQRRRPRADPGCTTYAVDAALRGESGVVGAGRGAGRRAARDRVRPDQGRQGVRHRRWTWFTTLLADLGQVVAGSLAWQTPGGAAPRHTVRRGTRCCRSQGQHDRASAEFRWPDVGERFNWAIDWFDAIARGNDATALWIVEEDGSEQTAELRRDGPALRPGRGLALGPRRRARATTCSSCSATRSSCGRRCSRCSSSARSSCRRPRRSDPPTCATASTAAERGSWSPTPPTRRSSTRCRATTCASSVGDAEGWHSYADAYAVAGAPVRDRHRSDGPAAALLHLRHHVASRSWSSTRRSPTRSATSRRCTGSALRPGDVHLAISSPGWAKHAWSCFFAPWIAEATIFVYNYSRFDAAALLEPDPPGGGHDVLRAADGLADADPGRPRAVARCAARAARRGRAAQPRGHRAGAAAPGA